MKAVAWAIILASLFIFEGLVWGRNTPVESFIIMMIEIGALSQVILFSYRPQSPQEIASE